MRPTINHRSIGAAWANALFVSVLQPSQNPGARQVRRAVGAAVRRFGSRGCAGRVAQEFGDHPDAAAARMRWARQAVAGAFIRPGVPGTVTARPGRHAAGRAA